MGRYFTLSVIFLMLVGGTGFALPDWINIYDFYGSPSSGSLGPNAADTNISNASRVFTPMPDRGFGPATTSFQNRDSFSSVSQTHATLQLKDRWLFDFLPGGHPRHPHHASRRRHLFNDQ